MAKYLYMAHIKWTPQVGEKGTEYYQNNWIPKHDELCMKIGLELVYIGTPFGVPEDSVWIYKGDTPTDEYSNFRGDVGSIEPRTIDWVRTTIVSLSE